MSRLLRAGAFGAAGGLAAYVYGTHFEARAYTLRHFDVPVLAAGAASLRVLHLSDLHIVPAQRDKIDWIRGLAALQPDLVISTGDMLSSADSVPAVLDALAPLFDYPGCFVPGNNDYYAPRRKNPVRYFFPDQQRRYGPLLPWPELATALSGSGWLDVTHVRRSVDIGGARIALAGTDDAHLYRVRYARIGGPADESAAVRIGVTHSPEPYLLDAFARDGYDLVLAGHTHGGQIRIPFGPAIVTNCGIDRSRARWLHRWDDRMYLHICAGLGGNPYLPLRIACRPEASLLTLVPRAD
jgi:predicted MPP superfamily phosphohydrolase